MKTYSTTEQVIGTWVDGKPVYELVVESTASSIDVSALSIDKLIFADVLSRRSTGEQSAATSGGRQIVYNLVSQNKINTEENTGDTYICYILRYTKTTDTATV